jgi:hypothetical protein
LTQRDIPFSGSPPLLIDCFEKKIRQNIPRVISIFAPALISDPFEKELSGFGLPAGSLVKWKARC